MSTVKRECPELTCCVGELDCEANVRTLMDWVRQCLQDLDAGRHAVGCGCDETDSRWTPNGWDTSEERYMQNACTHIVRCALEMRDYSVEAPDEVPR